MSNYGSFGLDERKVSTEKGAAEKWFYDPFTKSTQREGRYFYLCFSNWVITEHSVKTMLEKEGCEPITANEKCFKCNQRVEKLHYMEETEDALGVCFECLESAKSFYERPDFVAPGTQLKLF